MSLEVTIISIGGTATYGATVFADMSPSEFRRVVLSKWHRSAPIEKIPYTSLTPLPETWDWRTKGVVTPVKNQGLCGSCWAFGAVANIEGVWSVNKGTLTSLSEQQLLDCNTAGDNCMGGSTWDAYMDVLRMGGLETDADYPYKSHQGTCRVNQTLKKVYINNSIALPNDENQMAQYVFNTGPVAVSMNVLPLMLYTGGVARPNRIFCNPDWTNHVATIVGFGQENGLQYWLIKNSFGTWWGERGYLRLYRGAGVCGVDREPTTVIID